MLLEFLCSSFSIRRDRWSELSCTDEHTGWSIESTTDPGGRIQQGLGRRRPGCRSLFENGGLVCGILRSTPRLYPITRFRGTMQEDRKAGRTVRSTDCRSGCRPHGRRRDFGESLVPVGCGARPAMSERTTADTRAARGRCSAVSSQSPPDVPLESDLTVAGFIGLRVRRRVEVWNRLHRTPDLNPSYLGESE